jgi:predicted transcriptional regulator
MASQQLLVRISEDVARRLRRAVPARQRSKFIEDLLEQALPADGDDDRDPLYLAALAVEQDDALAAEMAEWETATIDDGLPKADFRRAI